MSASEDMPTQLLDLKDYLLSDHQQKGLELLCGAATLLDDEDDFRDIVHRAARTPGVSERSRSLMESYAQSGDPDYLYEIICEYGDGGKAIMSVGGDGLFSQLLESFGPAGLDAESPSWALLDYRSIHPRGWLVHCTSNSYHVLADGFTRGVEDMTKLGLTVHLSDSEKTGPGFGFAYTPNDFTRYGFDRRGGCRYGSDVVLFKAPYIRAWHGSDDEPQAIFWGPSASDLVAVDAERGYFKASPSDGEGDVEAEDLDDLIYQLESRVGKSSKPKPKRGNPVRKIKSRVLR